jgi:GT2 family glycosyltransferase
VRPRYPILEFDPCRIEIVTPVHNRKPLTLRCLRSLSRIDRTGLTVHVIIVDDGSTDGTSEEISCLFPDVEIIQGDGNLWYTGGTNRGIEAALKHNPDYILTINDDTIFHEGFLLRLVRCAEAHPKSIVGALLLSWTRPHEVFLVGSRWDTWYGGWRHAKGLTPWNVPQNAFDVDVIYGNCVLHPVEAVRQNGLMNAAMLPHLFADIEYTTRMRKAGWRLLIEPSAYVWCQPNHPPPPLLNQSIGSIFRELFLDSKSYRNLVQLFRARWYTAPSRFLAVPAYVIVLIRLALHAVLSGGDWPRWTDLPDTSHLKPDRTKIPKDSTKVVQ